MRAAELSINVLSDGSYLLDGGSLFGQVPKVLWERGVKADRRNRVRLGLNCLLIQSPTQNILVDTGIGSKEPENLKDLYGLSCNKLLRALRNVGLNARQIDIVILTHLHFDHAGGSTKIDRTGKAMPTFPKATYMVQRTCWEEAINPSERGRASFHPNDFLPLEERGQLTLIDGDCEVIPGVSVRLTNGHSMGHQVVLVNSGGERVAFLGDLVPTPYHIPLSYIPAFDRNPEETLEQKRCFLDQAQREGWLVILGHGYDQWAGYVESRNGVLQLRPVEL